jgi:hypothetical protein
MTLNQPQFTGNGGKRDPNHSPFPGMDPFLEQSSVWHDFHESFIYECRRLLVPQISPAYVAKLRPAVDLERENRIEIRDRETGRIITVIELLSPANKQSGQDRRQFLGKRDELLASEINYIEIDLLRAGPRMPVDNLPDCEYYALVSRAALRPTADLWPIRLAEPLPNIPVPLREPDADATLDLRRALDQAFEAGGYAVYIYSGEPNPALSADQQAWAKEQLRSGQPSG